MVLHTNRFWFSLVYTVTFLIAGFVNYYANDNTHDEEEKFKNIFVIFVGALATWMGIARFVISLTTGQEDHQKLAYFELAVGITSLYVYGKYDKHDDSCDLESMKNLTYSWASYLLACSVHDIVKESLLQNVNWSKIIVVIFDIVVGIFLFYRTQ